MEKSTVKIPDGQITKLPTPFHIDSQEERLNIDYIVTLGGDGTVLWASK